MPIKGGREIGGGKAERVTQDFLYQFLRPIIALGSGRTVVFPIILTEFTLNTNELLTQIRATLHLPILVLDLELFSKFLKRQNLLGLGGS